MPRPKPDFPWHAVLFKLSPEDLGRLEDLVRDEQHAGDDLASRSAVIRGLIRQAHTERCASRRCASLREKGERRK